MKFKVSINKLIILIFFIAFAIRLVFAIYAYNINVMSKFSDDLNYLKYAEAMIDKGPFILDNTPLIVQFVGPVLPSIIAVMILVFGNNWLPIFILNSLIGSLTCVLIFFIGKDIFNRKVGILAAIWSSVYILFITYVPRAGKEIWMIFLFTLIIYLFIHFVKSKKIILSSVATAFTFSLLIHLDERYFAYFPVFLIFFVLLDKINWKQGLKKALIFVVVVLILMIPWLIRNYKAYDRLVILTSRTTTITDKLFGYEKLPSYKNPVFGGDRWFISETQIDSVINSGINVKMRSGRKITNEQVKAMQNGILPKPITRLEAYWSTFNNLWQPIDLKESFYHTGYRFDGKWSLKHNLSVGLTYGILLPFFIFGLIVLIKENRNIGIFFLSIFIMHSLIHVLSIPFTMDRYRIPIDPIIIILGMYGMIELYNKIILRNKLKY